MHRTPIEEKIKQLEAQIAKIKAQAEKKKIRATPSLKFMKAGLKSIEKAIAASDDKVLRQQLDEARGMVSACLALCVVTSRSSKSVLNPRPRGTDNGSTPDANDLLGYLATNPGSSSESLTKQFSTDAGTLRPVMRKLIDDGKVSTKGQRRGMRYYASV